MRSGFSIVILAASVVVLALAIGGGLYFLHYQKDSKLKKLGGIISDYRMEINTFQTKYKALPGDMRNASSFPSVEAGNGDGFIMCSFEEGVRAWKMLELSGIGNYGELSGKGKRLIFKEITVNDQPRDIPSTNFDNIGVSLDVLVQEYQDPIRNPVNNQRRMIKFNKNVFVLGDETLAGNNITGAFSAKQANLFDAKFDDGVPKFGVIQMFPGSETDKDCLNKDSKFRYGTEDEKPACVLAFDLEERNNYRIFLIISRY